VKEYQPFADFLLWEAQQRADFCYAARQTLSPDRGDAGDRPLRFFAWKMPAEKKGLVFLNYLC